MTASILITIIRLKQILHARFGEKLRVYLVHFSSREFAFLGHFRRKRFSCNAEKFCYDCLRRLCACYLRFQVEKHSIHPLSLVFLAILTALCYNGTERGWTL